MLHVRVVSPQDLTPRLVTALTGEPGVRNLVVLPGAARRPDGDAVQFDLTQRVGQPGAAAAARAATWTAGARSRSAR